MTVADLQNVPNQVYIWFQTSKTLSGRKKTLWLWALCMREINVTNITITLGDEKNTEEKKERYIELGPKETLT